MALFVALMLCAAISGSATGAKDKEKDKKDAKSSGKLKDQIVGFWFGVDAGSGNRGKFYHFEQDGKVHMGVSASNSGGDNVTVSKRGTYTLGEDNTVSITIASDEAAVSTNMKAAVDKDMLTLTDPEGKEEKYKKGIILKDKPDKAGKTGKGGKDKTDKKPK